MLNQLRRNGSRIAANVAALGMLAVTVISTGCPSLIHVHHPVAPPPAAGDDPNAGYFTHYFQLNWNGGDLGELASLSVSHSRGIEVLTDPHVDQLSVVLQLDIQKDQHAALAGAYEDEVRSGSTLHGSTPKVILPARACTEQRTADGRPVTIQGVCVRDLTIIIPAKKILALELAWKGDAKIDGVELSKLTLDLPAAGTAAVSRLKGNLLLQGGGVSTSVTVDTVAPSTIAGAANGDLTSHLTTVSRLELKHIAGKVLLFVDQPEHANVSLDGAPIRQFPFQRP